MFLRNTFLRLRSVAIYTSLFFFLGLLSCTQSGVIFPETNDKLIVQCEFTEGAPFKIFVHRGVGLPSAYQDPSVPESPSIHVYNNEESFSVERVEDSLTYYKVDASLIANEELMLDLSVPGEMVEAVSAKSYIPGKTTIKDASFVVEIPGDDVNLNSYLVETSFELSDSNPEKYYEVSLIQERTASFPTPPDTSWSNSFSGDLYKAYYEELHEAVIWLSDRRSYIVNYPLLNGEKLKLQFNYDSQETIELSQSMLTVRTLTRDGYRFLRSLENASQPIGSDIHVLESNIEGGIGIFTGYSVSSESVLLRIE